MAAQFVICNAEVNAHQSLVVLKDGWYQQAVMHGGRSSQSGLTLNPTWVEEGAIVAHRFDAAVDRTRRGEEVAAVFDNHGTNPRNIRGVDAVKVNSHLLAWKGFRDMDAEPPSYDGSVEFELAQRASRPTSGRQLLTTREMEGLSRKLGATLFVGDESTWVEIGTEGSDRYIASQYQCTESGPWHWIITPVGIPDYADMADGVTCSVCRGYKDETGLVYTNHRKVDGIEEYFDVDEHVWMDWRVCPTELCVL